MTHLGERIADFVFEELSASEMAQARQHIGECSECQQQVEQFQRTHAMLKTSHDVEPPRHIVFEVEKSRLVPWIWRWLAPMAASAAVAMAVVTFAPATRIVERTVIQQQPVAQAVDYDKIITELRASQEARLVAELNKRDVAQNKEIQRVRGELALLDSYQRAVWRNTIENASSIQLLAQKSESRN